MSDEHESHGHSVAAWVCVTLLIIGFALGSLAVALLNVPSPSVGSSSASSAWWPARCSRRWLHGLAGQQGAGH